MSRQCGLMLFGARDSLLGNDPTDAAAESVEEIHCSLTQFYRVAARSR